MNEKIKKLVKQATEEVMKNTPSFLVTNEMWQEKFAELIVRECAGIAKHHVMNISTYSDADFVEEQVKEHFGVK